MPQAAKDLFDSFHSIGPDSYGNPRYYVPGFCLEAHDIANRKRHGLSKYRGRKFGPGYVVSTYSLEETVMRMVADRGEEPHKPDCPAVDGFGCRCGES